MGVIINKKFYQQKTLLVARQLIGKTLARKFDDGTIWKGIIMEVEAYVGQDDLASHASRGKTDRNEPMFGSAGNWYVYLVYGMHWMLNIVTECNEYPAAVLIRSTDKIKGPARITKALKINKKFNGLAAIRKNMLWIEDASIGSEIQIIKINSAPRIGVDYAGVWAKKPYRFYVE